ncbi:hypothetical protein M3Y99_01626100 [Aphelenchoides fujianensis]|nr:hypothetical protein M3Y99_01626100 [Aphelenchoides fujianensis]
MHSLSVLLLAFALPAAMAGWSSHSFGFGGFGSFGQPGRCRDITPQCARLQNTGICRTPAAHICGVTCGKCSEQQQEGGQVEPHNEGDEQTHQRRRARVRRRGPRERRWIREQQTITTITAMATSTTTTTTETWAARTAATRWRSTAARTATFSRRPARTTAGPMATKGFFNVHD